MRYYYIDVENVNNYFFNILVNSKKNDRLILFTSKNTRISTYLFKNILESGKIDKITVKEGFVRGNKDQAIDYFLMGELNNHIEKEPRSEYIIVSNDKGYDDFIFFKLEQNQNVKLSRLSVNNSDNKTNILAVSQTNTKLCKDEQIKNISNFIKNRCSGIFTKHNISFDYTGFAMKYIKSQGSFKTLVQNLPNQQKNFLSSMISNKDRKKLLTLL